MPQLHATKNPEISEREKRNTDRARKIAAQGMVLLQNDGTLPLQNEKGNIALFGNGARLTVKGGTGSGDVNSRFVVNVESGLEEAGFVVTTKAWMDRYDTKVEQERNAYFLDIKEEAETKGASAVMKLFTNPFQEPAIVPVTREDMEQSNADTAIYVLARNSGEGKDRKAEAGDYELFEEEKQAIQKLTSYYDKVIVVLNVGGVIDTKFLRAQKGINAILLMSQAGNIGGYALADVLTGQVNPSGHLATTWAENYTDYPGADTFSYRNGNVDEEYYEEGIFVGYRYFDSFGITPAYPFGYGSSYTSFEVTTQKVCVDKNEVKVTVTVRNTGNFTGREVLQVYVSAPEGKLEKPYQELRAYAKTKDILPGEEQELVLSWKVENMASYDEEHGCWKLEAGTYYVRVGVNSRDTHIVAALLLEEGFVTQNVSNRLKPAETLQQLSIAGATPYSYEGEVQEKESATVITLKAEDIPYCKVLYKEKADTLMDTKPEQVITLDDVKCQRASLDELVSQLTIEEMAELCVGTARGGLGGTSVIGAASALCPGAAGDTSSVLIESRHVPNLILADGPAGLRLSRSFMATPDGNQIPGIGDAPIPGMDIVMGMMKKPEIPENVETYYQYCTAIPIATLLAQTWDVEAIEEAGDIVGEEMEEFGVALWLAPGMNIHRNPLCGRNFEYYSEDPLVSGMCAAADTNGVQKHAGKGTTIKHFAFNNQEDNRMHTNANIGERAAREIYLKGFEIAIRNAQPLSIMTSYNLVNGIHTANSYDLLTAIARDEWGFEGVVMTDWGTTGSIEMEPGKTFHHGTSSAAGCIAAGNDLIMPGSQADLDDIISAVDNAEALYPLTKGQLQLTAKRVIETALKSLE